MHGVLQCREFKVGRWCDPPYDEAIAIQFIRQQVAFPNVGGVANFFGNSDLSLDGYACNIRG